MFRASFLVVLFSASALLAEEPRRDLYGDPLPKGAVKRLGTTRFRHGGTWIWAVVYSPDGKLLATGGSDKFIRLWDARTGKEQRRLAGHTESPTTLAFSFESKLLASGGGDATARVWDLATGKLLRTINEKGSLYSVAFLCDGKCLATNSTDERIRLWDTTTGNCLRTLEGHKKGDLHLAVSSDDKTLAAWTGASDIIYLWDVANSKPRCRIAGRMFSFSADSRLLAAPDTQTNGAGICLWESTSGKQVRYIPPVHKDSSQSPLCFSQDGRMLAGLHSRLDADQREEFALVIWEVSTGKERCRWSINDVLFAAAFSPDGKALAAAGLGQKVRLWNVRRGKETVISHGNQGQITALAFSKNGRLLASGSSDTTILLWPIPPLATKPPRASQELSTEKVRELWKVLADSDAAIAFHAMKTFSASPASTTAFLRQHLRPVPILDAETTRRLLADLDADDFAVRERATKELEKLCASAESPLRQALREKPSLELRRRAETLLDKMMRETPERLRQRRAVELLEWLKTAESRRFLEALAGGAADAWLTQEAKASLRRIGG